MRIYNYNSKKQNPNTPPKKTLFTSKSPRNFIGRLTQAIKQRDYKTLGTWAFRLVGAGILLIAFLFVYYSRELPDPNRLLGRNVPQSTKIYDRNENLLYEVHGEVKRTLVNLDQISPYLQNATIAVEDKNFYKHQGISIVGLTRAVIVDILSGSKRQGGSTITQQFVKNAMLSKDKSFTRKIKEIILSIEIEARFSKNDILKLYLNEIPYGRNAYGIEAASQTYFSKSAKDLSLAESAYLAALPQAPTYYNPSGPNFEALSNRQKYILELMKEQKYISEEEYNKAINEQVAFNQNKYGISAPHFVQYVQNLLAEKYGDLTLEQGGFKVYTTLDGELQKSAEEIVKTTVAKNTSKYKAYNGAMVAVDPKTGQILAMVGSKDYFEDPSPAGCTPGKNCLFEPNVNVAVSQRQPGSSFKPYAYLTAFDPDHKYAPATMLMDVVTSFGDGYTPRNYNGQSYGPVSMRKALAGSLNVPAVKTLALVGVEDTVSTAKKLGITSPLKNCGLSLVLGGCEVRLLDHTAAYAAIANMGRKHDTVSILKLVDGEGKTLEEYKEKSQQVVDPRAAFQLIDVMSDNSARAFVFGSNSALAFPNRKVGCKTGTTQNWHDGWTLCFTPNIAIGAWAGNNDGTLMAKGADGSFVAAPMVNALMKESFKTRPNEEFKEPQGIERITVDSVSGKLPTQYTPETKTEIFADYNKPTERDDVHVMYRIDKETGAIADDNTPEENIIEKLFTIFHSEKRDNPAWEGPVIAWAKANGYEYPSREPVPDYTPPEDQGSLQISFKSPEDGSTQNGPFTVSINATSTNKVEKVELFIDGSLVTTATNGPYQFLVTKKLKPGEHIISATATDSGGNTADTSITILVE